MGGLFHEWQPLVIASAELATHGICLGYGSNTKWEVGYNLL